MGRPHAIAVGLIALFVALGWFVVQQTVGPERPTTPTDGDRTGVVGGPVAPAPPAREDPAAVVEDDVVHTPRDVEILEETRAWAADVRLDTAEIGTILASLGERFVGAPYTPHLLDPPGEERLVVNLREFDCVTYVESILAMGRMVRDGRSGFADFADELRRIRYRDGELDGYASRLHYFSDWIRENERKDLVRDVTRELGGVPDREPVDFMTRNASAYVQLRDRPDRVDEIRAIEEDLGATTRHVVPQDRIGGVADAIRNGDIVAATSSVDGLDIAHTGFAIWIEGRLHLMHAPLVGSSVEISERPLAARIVRIDGQDGIMVARPL